MPPAGLDGRRRRWHSLRSGRGQALVWGALAVGLAACGGTTTSRSSSGTTSHPTPDVPVTTAAAPPTSTTTLPATAEPPTAEPPTAAPPTAQQIAARIATTHETNDPSEGFVGGSPVTVGDGSGGYLTAVPALRSPSADGHGSLVFFWHNQTFLGWDTNRESWNVQVVARKDTAIGATYADYAPGNPACCPSLPPVTVTYTWNGAGLAQDRTIPTGAIVGIAVTSG